jgi:hypothetical protein
VIWRFSDGTIAELGGKIEGDTVFAQELRAALVEDRCGVQLHDGPGGGEWLDRENPMLFDAWLKQEMNRPFRRELKLRMTERPEGIAPIPEDERAPHGDGADEALD